MKALAWRLTYGRPDTSLLHVAKQVPAGSPLWCVDIWAYAQLCAEECKTTKFTSLTDAFLSSAQPPSDKVEFLSSLLANYMEDRDSLHVREYYARFLSDYADSPAAFTIKMMYNLDSKNAVGKRCPSFSFRTMDDSTQFITDAALHGKVAILHFWAPELDHYINSLEGMYAQYRKDGLEIVSFCIGGTASQAAEYRKRGHPMKWKHARIRNTWDHDVMDVFDVAGAPYIILIDRDGIILQSGATFYLQEMFAMEVRAAVLKGK